MFNNCFPSISEWLLIVEIVGSPFVSVPVLSKITVSTSDAISKDSLSFINIPFFAAKPTATTNASGVASPKLHGHATTSTVTNLVRDSANVFDKIIFTMNVNVDIIRTPGTKYEHILSAILAIGDLEFAASTTNLTISDIVDSLPIFSALYSIWPS